MLKTRSQTGLIARDGFTKASSIALALKDTFSGPKLCADFISNVVGSKIALYALFYVTAKEHMDHMT